MLRRAISDKTRVWLLGEMEAWRADGLVSEEQSGRILELYETPGEAAERKKSVALFVLMSVAAFMVGLAVLLLIGYNWEAMPAAAKLGVIFGVILGTYAAGFWLRYRRQARLVSEVLFFLGCIFYGCGIWLIAQIFHIQSHYPDGLWFWALGVIPFALCLDTLLLHALLAALLASWVGTEILDVQRLLRPWWFGRWFGLPSACYTLPLLALPGMLWAYRKRSPATIGLYVPLLAWWVILLPVAWQWKVCPIYFIGAIGALFLAIAESHAVGSLMSVPYRSYGILLAAGVLAVLSFGAFNQEMLHDTTGPASLVAAVVIALLSVGAIVIGDLIRPKDLAHKPSPSMPLVPILRRQWLPVGLALLMAALCLWNALFAGGASGSAGHYRGELARWTTAVLLPTLATNAALVVLALWLMMVGLREDQGRSFASGVILFLLWAVLRYIDLFAEVGGMLGASLMFFLCGAALFGVARFWARRKETTHA